jgi:hypothetical protein
LIGRTGIATLRVSDLFLDDPATFEFDLAADRSDFLAVTAEFYGPGDAAFLLSFSSTGDIALDTPFTIMSFGGSSRPAASAFALSPDLVAAGWQANFDLADGATPSDPALLSVTFLAIPEPHILSLLVLAGILCIFAARRGQRI